MMPESNNQQLATNSQHTFLISGGGTGGGVYPAISVVSALHKLHPAIDVLWMGSTHGVETELVPRAGIDYVGVPGGPVVGMGLRAIPNLFKLLAGTLKAWGVVGRFKPGSCLVTGGWATIPAALACWLRGVPVVIYLPDVEPGTAIKALSRIATRVAVTSEASRKFFPKGQAVVTGYPLRAELLVAQGYSQLGDTLPAAGPQRAQIRKQAYDRFSLADDLPVLLVFGGSRGARSINRALTSHITDIVQFAQVLHISGSLDADWVAARQEQLARDLPDSLASRYHTFDYLHTEDMALALAAADLVVSRAGASAIGEFPLFALPAILVPYPHAWRYQKVNADTLEKQGAAMRLADDKLNDDLLPLVRRLLTDDDQRRAMADAAAALMRPDAAASVARLLTATAEGSTTPEGQR